MKQLIPFFFLAVLISVLVLANIYLSNRLANFFTLAKPSIFYFLFGTATVYMIAGLLVFSNSVSQTGSAAYMVAAIIVGFMLYLLLSVLSIDLLGLFVKTKAIYYGIAALTLSIAISIYGIYNSFTIKILSQAVSLNSLNKNIRAMHLSDIHIGHFRGKKFLQNIVDKTNSADVDIVFITGDLYDGRIRLKPEHLAPLKDLKAPVFFVEGNHDNYTGVKEIKNMLRGIGVRVLENESVNWGDLQIIGLNHMVSDNDSYNMHAANGGETIKSVLDKMKLNQSMANILLHHSPDGIEHASRNGIDLYLSGHTHAGQLFPITYIANMMFRFNKGLHVFKNTKIYVSQGAGTFGPPMRVGTHSEIAILNLVPQEKKT